MRRVNIAIVILLASLWYLPASAAAATITFPSATITSSDPFNIDVQIENVDFLYSFIFDLLYDPTVVELVNVQEGSFLTDTTIPPTTPPNSTLFGFDGSVAGTINIFNVLIGAPAGATGSGTLASVTFRPLTNGNASLAFQSLDFIAFFTSSPCDVPDGCFNPIELGPGTGNVVIQQTTPVPEPAALALFAVGLFGLARRLR